MQPDSCAHNKSAFQGVPSPPDALRDFLNSTADAFLTMDGEGSIVFANYAATMLSGYEAHELIGKSASLLLPEYLRSEFFSPDGRPLPSRIEAMMGKTTELIALRKDGLNLPIEASLSTWRAGKTTMLNLIIRDITERRRAEIELRVSREAIMHEHEELSRVFRLVEQGKAEWEKTMDCIQDMVILLSGQGGIRRCNRTFKDFLGMPYEQLLGQSCYTLLAQRGLRIEGSFTGEVDAELQPGDRWFRVSVYPLRAGGREDGGSVMTIHDTTQIKRVTRTLEQTNKEIETAYTELKQTQARILQQEKMASIGQLAAGVAHEINNPIGFISSNLNSMSKYLAKLLEYVDAANEIAEQCAAEGENPLAAVRSRLKIDYIVEDARKLIAESLDGAERVRTIVQNLKTFSRVDQAETRPADINECIETTLNIVWNELKYKATVQKEYGSLPRTLCHPQQLNQVFMNLLVNAAHAIEKQGVIAIKTWVENESILTSISDTGSGIAPDNLTRIFEPFFTTKEAGKGTGLGLSITYDIVKKHNGDISVQSVPGKGTTFLVKIPVVEENRHA